MPGFALLQFLESLSPCQVYLTVLPPLDQEELVALYAGDRVLSGVGVSILLGAKGTSGLGFFSEVWGQQAGDLRLRVAPSSP